jgi:molecular chaperone GrpE (heat shock protein)
MSDLNADIAAIDKAVDKIVTDINDDGKIDDKDVQKLVDMLQRVEDKLVATFAEFGVEIGDERID